MIEDYCENLNKRKYIAGARGREGKVKYTERARIKPGKVSVDPHY